MNWFEILKGKNRLGSYIQGGTWESEITKLNNDFTAGRIDVEEYKERRDAIRERFGKMLKANPYTLEGTKHQSLREIHAAKKTQKPNPKYKCDGCSDTATQECTVCAARFCDDCKEHFDIGYHPTKRI